MQAFGIFLSLVSFLILIIVRAVSPTPIDPHTAAIIAIHDVINILSIILSYFYAGTTPPASSPDTCALLVPTLTVILQLCSLPAFLTCLVLLPPPGSLLPVPPLASCHSTPVRWSWRPHSPPPPPKPFSFERGRDKVFLRAQSRFWPAKDMRDEAMRAQRG